MIKNLVLSSGSVKGLSFIGAYKILETNNLLDNIENILGSSIGSVFGLCLCLGYTSQEQATHLQVHFLETFYKLLINQNIRISV